MLETLTQGFESARERLRGVRKLDEESIRDSLRDVRMSLLEADVDLQVTKDFLARVKERVLGEKVATRVRDAQGRVHRATPGQHFVAVCEQELAALMGPVDTELATGERGVTSVMLIGLQGVGKTTVAAKLARYLASRGRRPLLVAADVQRPAAVLQLQQLGERIDVPVHAGPEGTPPVQICRDAAARVRDGVFDAVIYDTAGRLAIDDELMAELEAIAGATQPANTLLVCDALMGRDAVNESSADDFDGEHAALGVVLVAAGERAELALAESNVVLGSPLGSAYRAEPRLDRARALRSCGLEGVVERVAAHVARRIGRASELPVVAARRDAEHVVRAGRPVFQQEPDDLRVPLKERSRKRRHLVKAIAQVDSGAALHEQPHDGVMAALRREE